MTTNTTKNTRTNNTFKTFRRKATRLFLLIATFVACGYGTMQLASIGAKITGTQLRMAYFYYEISQTEQERLHYMNNAKDVNINMRSPYTKMADDAVEYGKSFSTARETLRKSSDPVIAFSAKHYFDFFTLCLGISCFILIAGIWYLVLKFFVPIIEVEEKILDSTIKVIFCLTGYIFSLIATLCFAIAKQFSHKKAIKKEKKPNDKVVKFHKRVG